MDRRIAALMIALVLCTILGGAALIMYFVPQNTLSTVSSRVDLANKVVTTLAVLAAGLWALFTFVLFRTAESNLQLTIQPQTVAYRRNLRIVLVNLTLRNVGKVVVRAGRCGCRLSVWKLALDQQESTSFDLTTDDVLVDDVDLLAGYDKAYPYEIEPSSEYHEFGNVVVASGSVLSIKATFYFGDCESDAITEWRLMHVE